MSQKIKGVIFFLILISGSAIAQNYFNSPYTRYLLGDIVDDGLSYNQSLGGSSTALRPHNQINYLNPASYVTQDTNSFIFQVGFTGRFTEINSELYSNNYVNFNMDYLTIGFPVTRWWKMSVGAVPFSRSQYYFSEQLTGDNYWENINIDYKGSGGYNTFYIGSAIELYKVLSLGINANYLFGNLNRKQQTFLTDLQQYSAIMERDIDISANSFYYRLGMQYYPKINEKNKIILGITFDPETNVKRTLNESTVRRISVSTNSIYSLDDSTFTKSNMPADLIYPSRLAVGGTYNYNDILSLTMEYSRQDWSGTEIAPSNFSAGLSEAYRMGINFQPVPLSTRTRVSYLKRMSYRMGYYKNKTYLYYNNQNLTKTMVSAGISLPLKTEGSLFTGNVINISYQHGFKGKTENGLIQEKYNIISIGLTFHDFWFLKRNYD